jgi:UDP-3-O-[3-hydroxymyristoyl] glucosamine N-acyltransferase
MSDSRFFNKARELSLEEIVAITGAAIVPSENSSAKARKFSDISPLETAGENDISFLDNIKYLPEFEISKAAACFVREKFAARAPKGMILLISDEPYYAYALTAQKFYPKENSEPLISPNAQIANSANIGKNVRIDAGAVIGENVKIGDGCWIGANSIIERAVEIGDNTRIGALCGISHSIIGSNVTIHRGAYIGQDGFGFAGGRKGITKLPQTGRVIIGDDVEIGSGTCIDRGAGHDTKIGSHSKIDNLVQIAHNVQVGKHTMIAAQTGISGSTIIGDRVLVGGQVGFAGHTTVGNGAKIAAQSGIMTDIPAGATYGGYPAVSILDWHRQTATVAKLSKRNPQNKLSDK